MSTSGMTTSLLSQIADSPSNLNQFVTDLNQLAQDLQSGNVSAAQEDYVTLSEDALNGATSSTASSSASGITGGLLTDVVSSLDSSSSFVGELNQLGTDLHNGDLTSSQEDMLNLDSTALNSASSVGASSPSVSPTFSTATKPPSQAEIAELVNAIIQAMQDGDTSVISAAMSQLAAISPSSQGASILQQDSENLSSGGSSISDSTSQLLSSLGTGTSSSSDSILNEIA